jgi:hypothetical protein
MRIEHYCPTPLCAGTAVQELTEVLAFSCFNRAAVEAAEWQNVAQFSANDSAEESRYPA